MEQNRLLPPRCHGPPSGSRAPPHSGTKPPISSRNSCARIDSNHHGEISPQGPQPHTSRADAFRASRSSNLRAFADASDVSGAARVATVLPRRGRRAALLEHFDFAPDAAGASEAPVGGEQRYLEHLCECDVGGVVGGEVVPQGPAAFEEGQVWSAAERDVCEVRE